MERKVRPTWAARRSLQSAKSSTFSQESREPAPEETLARSAWPHIDKLPREWRSEAFRGGRPRSSQSLSASCRSCATRPGLPDHFSWASTRRGVRDRTYPLLIFSTLRHRPERPRRRTFHRAEFRSEAGGLCGHHQRQECASWFPPRSTVRAALLPGPPGLGSRIGFCALPALRAAGRLKGRQQPCDVIFQSGVEFPGSVEFTLSPGFFNLPCCFERA